MHCYRLLRRSPHRRFGTIVIVSAPAPRAVLPVALCGLAALALGLGACGGTAPPAHGVVVVTPSAKAVAVPVVNAVPSPGSPAPSVSSQTPTPAATGYQQRPSCYSTTPTGQAKLIPCPGG